MLILLSKYWLVEVIENDCIVTRVGVYNEKLPEPSGNPSGSGNISSYTPPLVTIQLQEEWLHGERPEPSGDNSLTTVTISTKYSASRLCACLRSQPFYVLFEHFNIHNQARILVRLTLYCKVVMYISKTHTNFTSPHWKTSLCWCLESCSRCENLTCLKFVVKQVH